ncbi:MAG: hypothetical protein LBF85_03345 [Tannerella sp.]|nr:hypothetical protein [Tannerella sp.]
METMIHHLIQPADTVPGDDAAGAATPDERFSPLRVTRTAISHTGKRF